MKGKIGLNSFVMHVLAMLFMLFDHLYYMYLLDCEWMGVLGRMAFPMFAFMIVEGYFHTKDYKKYIKRLLIFALISEVPFNLALYSSWIYPFHQNVLWTFIIALFCINKVDTSKKDEKKWRAALKIIGWVALAWLIGTITFVDYGSGGVLTVLAFYFFRKNKWYNKILQFAGLLYIHCLSFKGLQVPINLFGWKFIFTYQGLAVLSLIPIWLYNERQGPKNKFIKYFNYGFYPVHLLLLALPNMLNLI